MSGVNGTCGLWMFECAAGSEPYQIKAETKADKRSGM